MIVRGASSPLHSIICWGGGKVQQVCAVRQIIGRDVLSVAKEDVAQD